MKLSVAEDLHIDLWCATGRDPRELLPREVWSADMLVLAAPFQGATTVIKHHAPHPHAMPHPESELAPVYANDFSDVILKYRPARWLYGHMHHPVDFRIGGCQIQNVSVGYPAQEDLVRSPPQGRGTCSICRR